MRIYNFVLVRYLKEIVSRLQLSVKTEDNEDTAKEKIQRELPGWFMKK